jgi:uncharacterized lipoprotein YmbA
MSVGIFRLARFHMLTLLVFTLGGCLGSGRPVNFYMLQPIAPPATKVPGGASSLIGVGPVRLPGYLDRPQIVLSSGQNQLKLDEFQRWSEPLKGNFARVLAENLSRLIPSDQVLTFPWQRSFRPNYVVEVNVEQFHVTSGGQSVLDASWSVFHDGKPVYLKKSSYSLPADVGSYEAMVAAQSATLGALSREIAGFLRTLPLHETSDQK